MISDDDLMLLSAYVDGELEGQSLTQFRERLLAEPVLRRELESIEQNDSLLKEFATQIDFKPVPSGIQSLVAGHSAQSAIKLFAVAAAVFLVTVGTFLMAPQSSVEYVLLDELESGKRVQKNNDYFEIVASFRQHDGNVCRELMTRSTHQVLCRRGDTWQPVVEVPRLDTPEGSYQPAGAGDVSEIDAYIQAHMAGSVLDSVEEKRLIEESWR